ncbi:ISL3 family transposase [Streptosporangium lutulentum]|uniref:Transposase n=1 Tax=Streptosporangium lutulentum TaxID=1461250 RepID=A0ABT9QPF4_9ACTN|nr:ISL3 family transposase [Streptosporangium lutulentum]MDP9848133.1 transposase [Streptosporangium lutulentum]
MLHSPAGDDACCLHLFCPALKDVHVQGVEDHGDTVLITARTMAAEAECPQCGLSSARVHSRYRRTVWDLAAGGRPVMVALQVRRFFCGASACEREIFAEQVDGLTQRHARRTGALRALLTSIAIALAGRAGARLAAVAGVPVGRSTLLRMLRALPDPEVGEVTVLGVDDFAKKRGNSYGTILVDMDTHRPIDLLDGRTAGDLAAWLKDRPGVQVICRDRAGSYADGAREGAPEAVQVADRFHLWQNLAQALEKTIRAHRSCLQEAPEAGTVAEDETGGQVEPVERPTSLDSYGNERPIVARTRERYAQVQILRSNGASLNAISRELGLAFRTARKFAGATSVEELLAPTLNRSSKLDAFKPYLTRRWNEGCTNATQLHQEIQAQGWTGNRRAVQGWLTPLRGYQKVQPAPCPPPKPRHITGWIMSHPDHLTAGSHVQLKEVLGRCLELDTAARHIRSFATMMTNRDGHLLDDWIAETAAGSSPQLAAFATGLRRDHAAVTAGLSLPHSSGAVEGIVNKIKFLKRQMFGRANFDLLRIRVLHYR